MQLPFFYIETFNGENQLSLEEDSSRHIIQVLRKKKGDKIRLTDGNGNLMIASLEDEHKKHCLVTIDVAEKIPATHRKVSIAISLIKNTNRFEWFLEKAAEIGVIEIIPLICDRTEKEKFRLDRLRQILVSAMLQSQQAWMPLLHEPIAYNSFLQKTEVMAMPEKFIAHCEEGEKGSIKTERNPSLPASLILIGPEGDFTKDEISVALEQKFIPVTLGDTRLRTETAGVVAATLLRLV